MKKQIKKLLIFGVFLVLNILFFVEYDYSFSFDKVGNTIVTIFVPFISGVMMYLANVYLENKNDKKNAMEQMNKVLQNDEETGLDTYMRQLEEVCSKNVVVFTPAVDRFASQVSAFYQKENALKRLVDLNNGKARKFLLCKNDDVKSFLIGNLKRFVKRVIVYDAKTKKNLNNAIEESGINGILEKNDEIIECYDKLLEEVSRMGDDFNLEDPGLQNVVSSLQSMRVSSEDDENDEIELHLN